MVSAAVDADRRRRCDRVDIGYIMEAVGEVRRRQAVKTAIGLYEYGKLNSIR